MKSVLWSYPIIVDLYNCLLEFPKANRNNLTIVPLEWQGCVKSCKFPIDLFAPTPFMYPELLIICRLSNGKAGL